MAQLDTYAKLKAAIFAWTDTAAGDYSAQSGITVGELILLGHQRINREVRCRQMEGTLTGTISSGVIPLPSDFVDVKYLRLDNEQPNKSLIKRTASWMYDRYPHRAASSRPSYYAREFTNLIFGPYPDSGQVYTVSGVYWKRQGGLTLTTTASGTITNAVFAAHPDLYLAASIAEAIPFLAQDQRIAIWEAKYQNIKQALMEEVNAEFYEGSEVSFDA